jgi:hypothetical protein
MRNGEIPQLLKLSSRTASAQADIVAYSWDVVPAGKTKIQMMKEGDYSFRKRGLFKKVYIDEANKIPAVLKEGKYENYVFQMINAWGDGFRANEFYTEPTVSVIDNGFVKVEPTTYTKEYTFQDKKYTMQGATSPERSNNYVARYFGAQAAETPIEIESQKTMKLKDGVTYAFPAINAKMLEEMGYAPEEAGKIITLTCKR